MQTVRRIALPAKVSRCCRGRGRALAHSRSRRCGSSTGASTAQQQRQRFVGAPFFFATTTDTEDALSGLLVFFVFCRLDQLASKDPLLQSYLSCLPFLPPLLAPCRPAERKKALKQDILHPASASASASCVLRLASYVLPSGIDIRHLASSVCALYRTCMYSVH